MDFSIPLISTEAISVKGSMEIRDEHHTMDELYMHRMALTLALGRSLPKKVPKYKSKQHDDGSMFDGSFIVGIELPGADGYISYHYGLEYWDLFSEDVWEVLPKAPKFDGHTPDDVVKRLGQFAKTTMSKNIKI